MKLGEYKGLDVQMDSVEVADEEVEAKLKEAQEQNAREITVEDRAVPVSYTHLDVYKRQILYLAAQAESSFTCLCNFRLRWILTYDSNGHFEHGRNPRANVFSQN